MQVKQSNPLLLRAVKHPHQTGRMITKKVVNSLLSLLRPGNIAMFHIGRSGSTVLADMLDQHPDIHWDKELYAEIIKSLDKPTEALMVGTHTIAADPIHLLKKKMSQAGQKFYGFEIKFFHLCFFGTNLTDYVEALQQLDFSHFIVLERKNYLRKIVSSLIANKTGLYHQKDSNEVKLNKINLDVDQIGVDRQVKPLMAFLQDYHDNFCLLDKLLDPTKTLKLTYEDDILANPHVGYQRVCEFLNLKEVGVSVRLSRTNPYKLNDLVVNFEDMEYALQETPFEWMLYD